MFYKNTLKARRVKNQDFEFDFLSKSLNVEKDENSLKIGQPQMHYNFPLIIPRFTDAEPEVH